MVAKVQAIYRYPVKGLTAEKLQSAKVTKGKGFRFDRFWAIENGTSKFDADNPKWITKKVFTQLTSHPKLAKLAMSFDEKNLTLSLTTPDTTTVSANLKTSQGIKQIEAFIDRYLNEAMKGAARLVSASGHHFSDIPDSAISMINLASVADLSQKIGQEVDPLRFRGNIYIEGLEPWEEMDWEGKPVSIAGKVLLQATELTGRCPATHVNLQTGERDIEVRNALLDIYGHNKCGIYMMATMDGQISVDDSFAIG